MTPVNIDQELSRIDCGFGCSRLDETPVQNCRFSFVRAVWHQLEVASAPVDSTVAVHDYETAHRSTTVALVPKKVWTAMDRVRAAGSVILWIGK